MEVEEDSNTQKQIQKSQELLQRLMKKFQDLRNLSTSEHILIKQMNTHLTHYLEYFGKQSQGQRQNISENSGNSVHSIIESDVVDLIIEQNLPFQNNSSLQQQIILQFQSQSLQNVPHSLESSIQSVESTHLSRNTQINNQQETSNLKEDNRDQNTIIVEQEDQKKLKKKPELSNQNMLQKLAENQSFQKKKQNKPRYCNQHNLNVFYQYKSERGVNKLNICNLCISNSLNKHFKHQIECKKHKQPIKYKIEPKFKEEQQTMTNQQQKKQLYICQECKEKETFQYFNILQICSSHFKVISQICFHHQCTKNDAFLLCSDCQHSYQHPKILLTKDSLLNYLRILRKEQYINITQVDHLRKNIEQKLDLKMIEKKIVLSLQQKWCNSQIFKSFSIQKNEQIEKLIDKLMENKTKQHMATLVGFAHFKEIIFNNNKKKAFLEIINDDLNEIITYFSAAIVSLLKQLHLKIEKSILTNIEEVEQKLKIKYRRIKNIVTNSKFDVLEPIPLQELQPNNASFVNQINFIKFDQNDQESKFKLEKRKLFNQLDNPISMLNNSNIENLQKVNSDILNVFTKTITLDSLKHEPHYKTIKQLCQKHQEIENQQKQKSNACPPLQAIKRLNFTNLRIVTIKYISKFTNISFDAFELFHIVHVNERLEEITVQGVKIANFENFIQYLRYFICNQDDGNEYMKRKGQLNINEKQTQQKKWMKNFNPYSSLKLRFDAQITIDFKYPDVSSERIKDIQYFCSRVGAVSYIKVIMKDIMSGIQQKLKKLLSLAEKMPQIRLGILNHHVKKYEDTEIFLFLIKRLCAFSNICEFEFKEIYFNNFENADELVRDFQQIFANNKISHLILQFCKNFPDISNISGLKFLKLHLTSFNGPISDQHFLNKIIKSNQQISVFQIFSTYISAKRQISQEQEKKQKIDFGPLNKLESLKIEEMNWSQKDLLKSISMEACATLRRLHLTNFYRNITQQSFRYLFSKLKGITYIQLCEMKFNCQLLLQIPSGIEQLHLFKCSQLKAEVLKQISSEWPSLKKLSIQRQQLKNQDRQVLKKILQRQANMFKGCSFKGLVQLKIDKSIKDWNSDKILSYVKNGVIVIVNEQ